MASIKSTMRDARIDLWLNQEHKRMIEQAASVTRQSLRVWLLAAQERATADI